MRGTGLAPVVVLGIGLGSIKEMGLDRYARVFNDLGYACMAFDYRGFGESEGSPRQVIDIGGQLEDWRAAIECARRQPDVDPEQVVLWGTSFGGGHVIYLAAEGIEGVVAGLAQCPFTDGLASALASHPVSLARVGIRAVRDAWAVRRGSSPVMVSTAGPPGSAALMAAPDAEVGFLRLVPLGATNFRNEVAARIGLQILRYRPAVNASDIPIPIWVGISDLDTVAPPRRSAKLMRKAPHSDVHHYAAGHFEIYDEGWASRVVRDQTEFLTRHAPLARRA